MPEPVFITRGYPQPPLDTVLSQPVPLADLKILSELDKDIITAIHKRLAEATGFLGPKQYVSILKELIGDDRKAMSVYRVLDNLDLIPSTRVKAVLQRLRQQNQSEFPIDDPGIARLEANLSELQRRCSAVDNYEKAQKLSTLTGQQLESLEIVCDLRPIFDNDRSKIEGMMPYTRLRVVATGDSGLPVPFEVELTRQQVHDLTSKTIKAAKKLEALFQFVERSIPAGVPDLPLTYSPELESQDE